MNAKLFGIKQKGHDESHIHAVKLADGEWIDIWSEPEIIEDNDYVDKKYIKLQSYQRYRSPNSQEVEEIKHDYHIITSADNIIAIKVGGLE
jgi:hypothetical protein